MTKVPAQVPPSFPPMDLKPTEASLIRTGPLAVPRFLVECFSNSNSQRDPPSSEKTKHVRLITIAASHYCEKARWGLDLLELDNQSPIYYTEDGHSPPFHSFETLPASGYKHSATPMLVYPDGTYLVKSDAILRSLCPFLYPKDILARVEAMEDDLGLRVGTSVRAIIYYHTLRQPYYQTIAEILSRNTSKIETFLLNAMLEKGIAKAMKQTIKINKETHDVSLQTLRQVFAELSETLSDGREYLCDEQPKGQDPNHQYGFTAADLTLAALSAPILQPDCYHKTFGVPSDTIPTELVKLRDELRATKAGQHVLRVYEKHRPVVAGHVLFKSSIRRDQIAWRRLLVPVASVVVVVTGVTMAAAAAWNRRRGSPSL